MSLFINEIWGIWPTILFSKSLAVINYDFQYAFQNSFGPCESDLNTIVYNKSFQDA